MKRPIAMKCTQEQFDSIKYKINESFMINKFDEYPYLINNFADKLGYISNTCEPIFNSEVHEEWDEQVFLEACGIEASNVGRYDIYQEIGTLMDKAKKQGINLKIIIE